MSMKIFGENIKLCVRIDDIIAYYKHNFGKVEVPTGYGEAPKPPIKLAPYLKAWKKEVYALLKNKQLDQAEQMVVDMESIKHTRTGYQSHDKVWSLINKYK